MFHYHIWFELKPERSPEEVLAAVRSFLSQMQETGQISAFQLLRNTAAPPKTTLLTYHALIEFADGAQFSTAFKNMSSSGIHNGLHGEIMSAVAKFQIEVFQSLDEAAP